MSTVLDNENPEVVVIDEPKEVIDIEREEILNADDVVVQDCTAFIEPYEHCELELHDEFSKIESLQSEIQSAQYHADALTEVAQGAQAAANSTGLSASEIDVLRVAVEHFERILGVDQSKSLAFEAYKVGKHRNAERAFEGINDFVSTVWDKIIAAVKAAVHWLKTMYDKVKFHFQSLERKAKQINEAIMRVHFDRVKATESSISRGELSLPSRQYMKALSTNGTFEGGEKFVSNFHIYDKERKEKHQHMQDVIDEASKCIFEKGIGKLKDLTSDREYNVTEHNASVRADTNLALQRISMLTANKKRKVNINPNQGLVDANELIFGDFFETEEIVKDSHALNLTKYAIVKNKNVPYEGQEKNIPLNYRDLQYLNETCIKFYNGSDISKQVREMSSIMDQVAQRFKRVEKNYDRTTFWWIGQMIAHYNRLNTACFSTRLKYDMSVFNATTRYCADSLTLYMK